MKKLIIQFNEDFNITPEIMNNLEEALLAPNKPLVLLNGLWIKKIDEIDVPDCIEYELGGGLLDSE